MRKFRIALLIFCYCFFFAEFGYSQQNRLNQSYDANESTDAYRLYVLISGSLYSTLDRTDFGNKNLCSIYSARFKISKDSGIIEVACNVGTPKIIERAIIEGLKNIIKYPDFLKIDFSEFDTSYVLIPVLITYNKNKNQTLADCPPAYQLLKIFSFADKKTKNVLPFGKWYNPEQGFILNPVYYSNPRQGNSFSKFFPDK